MVMTASQFLYLIPSPDCQQLGDGKTLLVFIIAPSISDAPKNIW
jgi:hypothetical protein